MAGEAGEAAAVELIYYTDPLCCWSWAQEPQWRLLLYAFAGRLTWRYRMGGMISGWDRYDDPVNAVHRPAQMGPLWMQAQHMSGMPIDPGIWMEDAPASSWPACLAVKAAALQSPQAADLYLRRLREAVMAERRNIARREVLCELAAECASRRPDVLDADRLCADLDGPEAQDAFREDLKDARYHGIGRFPALVVRRPGTAGLILVGWRPFAILRAAIAEVAPQLGPGRRPDDEAAYRAIWPEVTARELEEALHAPADWPAAPLVLNAGAARQVRH